MEDEQASSSRVCSSPSRLSKTSATGMRSPTKIRTPTKLKRPRETHYVARNKESKKRTLEYSHSSHPSGLPAPKRLKLGLSSSQEDRETQELNTNEIEATETTQETEVEQGYTGQDDSLERRVEVAQALEEDLLKGNARMRLKALSLREEVDFYYQILAKIELLAAQTRQSEEKLADKVQSIISASKPDDTVKE